MTDENGNGTTEIETPVKPRARVRPAISEPEVVETPAGPQVYKVTIESTTSYTDGGHAEGVWNGSHVPSGDASHRAKLTGPDGKTIFTRAWTTSGV